MGRVRGEPVAYGELWLDDDEGEVELAHLIVAPSARGSGLGAALTRALVGRARADQPQLAQVILRVRPGNPVALRTYAAAGFLPVASEESAAWNAGQREAFVWMRMP